MSSSANSKDTTNSTLAANGSSADSTVNELEHRRLFVKNMVSKAWKGAKNALGDNSILSIKQCSSQRIKVRNLVSQDSLINAMTTFAVTGMEADFAEGLVWVETQLEFDRLELDKDLDVSRVVTNYIGAMLSCFALTWNRVFLDKAEMLATKLEPAYRSETGLPYHSINTVSGQATGSLVWLSEVAAGAIEYAYLSDVTDDPRYKLRCEAARKFLVEKEKPQGLYMFKVDVETGKWATTTATLSFASCHFYLNLVKSYMYSNKKDTQALQMYVDAMANVQQNGLLGTSRTGLMFARNFDYSTDVRDDFMSHCAGYLGALFALGATCLKTYEPEDKDRVEQHLTCARKLTETCHEASERTATKLIPSRFYFNDKDDATNSTNYDREYSLSP